MGILCLNHTTMSAKALCIWAVCPQHSSICSSRQILLPRYLMHGLRSLDEIYKEYSFAPTDDLVKFWKTKVKGTTGQPSRWRRHPRRRWASKFRSLCRCGTVHKISADRVVALQQLRYLPMRCLGYALQFELI